MNQYIKVQKFGKKYNWNVDMLQNSNIFFIPSIIRLFEMEPEPIQWTLGWLHWAKSESDIIYIFFSM